MQLPAAAPRGGAAVYAVKFKNFPSRPPVSAMVNAAQRGVYASCSLFATGCVHLQLPLILIHQPAALASRAFQANTQ